MVLNSRLLAIAGVVLWLLSRQGFSFVLLSGPAEATLPVTEVSPRVVFLWDGKGPELDKKEDLDIAHEGVSESDYFLALLEAAAQIWTDVPAAYVELVIRESLLAEKNDLDEQFSIVTSSNISATAAAFASPSFSEDQKTIIDCDIVLAERGTTAKAFLYTLVHELGHCLGLGHNHSNYGSIMGYARGDLEAKLGLDDQAGVIYLYPQSEFAGEGSELPFCGSVQPGFKDKDKGISLGSRGGGPAHLLIALLLLPLVMATMIGSIPKLQKTGSTSCSIAIAAEPP